MKNRKPNSIIPHDDKKRLEKLNEYEIFNSYPEQEFDNIAQLAKDIFDCPSAFITFVGDESVFYKSNQSSIPQNVVPRNDSICSLTILEEDVTLIEDASQFDDLMKSPLVSQPGGIRFYAGAPLITSEGYKLGSICVVDDKPRKATEKQLKILANLSKLVIDKLENRVANKKIVAIQTEYINRSIHDLKNNIGNLVLATSILKEAKLEGEYEDLPIIINRNAQLLSDRMNRMLNLSKIESSAYKLSIGICNVTELLDEVIMNYSTLINSKNQKVKKKYANNISINADCKAISEIFENLLSNALKYSFANSEIVISSEEDQINITFGFHDHGQGLNSEDLQKLFIRYATLSSIPTAKESSTGLGLTITKILVELHQGKIWGESKGKDKGSSFFVSFPRQLPQIHSN